MKRLPMRKIKDALRLKAAGLSTRQIAASLGVGRTTAGDYLKRADDFDVGWPLPDDLTDEALERWCREAPLRLTLTFFLSA